MESRCFDTISVECGPRHTASSVSAASAAVTAAVSSAIAPAAARAASAEASATALEAAAALAGAAALPTLDVPATAVTGGGFLAAAAMISRRAPSKIYHQAESNRSSERYSQDPDHSTVTLFARLRGWSTSVPFATAT